MNTLNYLIQVNAYLLLFYLFYLALLRNETFFKLNRFYLITTALISLFIPLLQSDWVRSFFITEQVYEVSQSAAIIIYDIGNFSASTGQRKTEDILWAVYLSGVGISFLIFICKLYAVRKAIRKSAEKQAFSFFKTIVVDPSLPQKETIEQHERVHAEQWHSADVLFFEFLAVFNWFNPVIYGFKKAIKNIHEFIADENAAIHEKSKAAYALILLNNSFGVPQYQLTNSFFNQSLLKRRILMLHKKKSRRTAILKYGLSAPLFAGMLLFSSAMASPVEIAEELKTGIQTIAKAVDLEKRIQKIIENPVTLDDETSKAGNPVLHDYISDTQVHADDTTKEVPASLAGVEVLPQFRGGQQEWAKFLSNNLIYPKEARENKVEGRVIVQFVVEKDGSITNISVLKGIGYGCDEAAMNAIKNSPKWAPGTQNGKEVRVQYVAPIVFALDRSAEDMIYNRLKKKPLYIIDDVIQDENFDPRKDLVPDQIKSIDVLKDEKAKIIYGSKGVNGVVLIHTKAAKTLEAEKDTSKRKMETPHYFPETAPLFILDGKEIEEEEFKKLDVNSIELINVFKDKSAVGKYGDKGKNGVVEITTKKKE